MTEKDLEIQNLKRELDLAMAEINRLREMRDYYCELSQHQREIIDHLMDASR